MTSSEIDEAPAGWGIGCFFTGGVDSFYTVLKRREELTALIYVDFPLKPEPLRSTILRRLRECSAEFGLPLIDVSTSLRAFFDQYIDDWDLCFGARLASVAHVLATQFRKVYIASGPSYTELGRAGIHPMLDLRWSTEGLEFVHDGCEATRGEKIERISRSDIAMRYLQVCWEHLDGAYNCSRCEKCLRTMVALRAVGALDRCRTFERPISLREYLLRRPTTRHRDFAAHTLAALHQRKSHRTLEIAVRLHRHQGILNAIRRLSIRLRALRPMPRPGARSPARGCGHSAPRP